MKTRAIVAAVVLLVAGLASAERVPPVLTQDNALYAVSVNRELHRLELARRHAGEVTTIVVPGTDDAATESHPRLVWDKASSALFVVWHRADDSGDEIRLATLSAAGEWSEPLRVSGCATATRAGLQVVLTRAGEATLVHAAWWKLAGVEQTPEYALVAFEGGKYVSTDVSNLDDLAMHADDAVASAAGTETESVGDVLHPPLAMARAGEEVDVAYGKAASTSLTRIKLRPRKIGGDARLWKPSRSGGTTRVPRANLVSATGAPVQSFLSNGRIVLYTPDAQFRYVVFENGAWTPTRMIRTDETLGTEEMLQHLREMVEKQSDRDGEDK